MKIEKRPKSNWGKAEFDISIIERAMTRIENIKKHYRDTANTWQNKNYYKAVDAYTKLALEHGKMLRGLWERGYFI